MTKHTLSNGVRAELLHRADGKMRSLYLEQKNDVVVIPMADFHTLIELLERDGLAISEIQNGHQLPPVVSGIVIPGVNGPEMLVDMAGELQQMAQHNADLRHQLEVLEDVLAKIKALS